MVAASKEVGDDATRRDAMRLGFLLRRPSRDSGCSRDLHMQIVCGTVSYVFVYVCCDKLQDVAEEAATAEAAWQLVL